MTRTAFEARVEWCPGCHEAREFETPPCAEHRHDCPELACVMCGWALVGGFELLTVAGTGARRGAV